MPAAGLGLRLKSPVPKPLVKIAGTPILIHCLRALAVNKLIRRIIIAVNQENMPEFRSALGRYRVKKRIDLVLGGPTRKDSVGNCLKNVSPGADFVLVHDAVRPFVSQDLIQNLIKETKIAKAVICGVPVKATIKRVSGYGGRDTGNGCYTVKETLDRSNVWEIQTPQVFEKKLLLVAYKKYGHNAVTDDASLMEKMGIKVRVIEGSYFNIKITSPEDLIFARAIIKNKHKILNPKSANELIS